MGYFLSKRIVFKLNCNHYDLVSQTVFLETMVLRGGIFSILQKKNLVYNAFKLYKYILTTMNQGLKRYSSKQTMVVREGISIVLQKKNRI